QAQKSQLETMQQDRARIAQEVKVAEGKWSAQCKAVGLPERISPQSGLVLLQERKELLTTYDSWCELSGERKTLSQQARDYEREVSGKAAVLGMIGDTTEAQEAAMWKALVAARDAQSRHDQSAAQVKTAKGELE